MKPLAMTANYFKRQLQMKNLVITIWSLIIISIGMGMSTSWAADLGSAKNAGLVGETQSGYLEAVTSPSNEIKALINGINAKRKAKFEKVAKQNGVNANAVGKIQAEKWIKKTKSGHYVKVNGKWKKK